MNITNIRVTKSESENSKLLAYVDVTIDNAIAIHDIRVIKGDTKNFIAFPNKKRFDKESGENKYEDLVHPINTETRKTFEDKILEEFNKLA